MRLTRVYLDTNILIGAFEGDLPAAVAQKFRDLIGAVSAEKQAPFVTSELTLAEVLVRPMRLGLLADITGMDNVLTSSPWLDVAPVGRNVLWGAANLRSQYRQLRLPDAIHLATAIAHRCSHFLTADMGIKGTYGVQILYGEGSAHTASLDILRPDETTLDHLIAWLRA